MDVKRKTAGRAAKSMSFRQRRTADAVALNEIAELIAGGPPPEWLPKLLGDWRDGPLFVSRLVAAAEPTPRNFQADLNQLHEAALLIFRSLYSPTMSAFLSSPSPGTILDGQFTAALGDLFRRVHIARSHPAAVNASGEKKKGRGRVRTPRRLPPEIVCAAFIAELWRHVRGKPSARSGPNIANIAEKYWQLAGGEAHSQGDEPFARWKHRFVSAASKTAELDELRNEINRLLRERDCKPDDGARLK